MEPLPQDMPPSSNIENSRDSSGILKIWTWECDLVGNYISCSSEIEKYTGFKPEDIIGKSFYTWRLTPEDQQNLSELLQTGNLSGELDTHLVLENNKILPVRMHIFSRVSETGVITGWHGFNQVLVQEQTERLEPQNLPESGLPKLEEAPLERTFQPINGFAYDHGKVSPSTEFWTEEARLCQINHQTIFRPASEKSQALIVVPFQFGEYGTGVIEIIDDRPDKMWSEVDRTTIEVVTHQLSMSLENSLLYAIAQQELKERYRAEEEILRRNQDLARLNQIGQQLSKLSTQEEIFDFIYDTIGQLIDNRNLIIALYDSKDATLSFPVYVSDGKKQHVSRQYFANGIPEYVIRYKTPLLLTGQAQMELSELGIDLPEHVPQSLLAIPMLAGEKPIGTIILQNFQTNNAYNFIHMELLSTIATQTATSLENAILFTEIKNALDVIANREWYQANIARAVASLSQHGSRALPEVLEALAEATHADGVFYAEIKADKEGLFWRPCAYWASPLFEQPPKNIFEQQRLSVKTYQSWTSELQRNGFYSEKLTTSNSEENKFLIHQNISSLLLLAVPGKVSIPSFIAFLQVKEAREWHNEEIGILRVAADALANTNIREELLDQLQNSLDESQMLYNTSHSLALASNIQEMLNALQLDINTTMINRAVLILFEYDPSGRLTNAQIAANWYRGEGTPPLSVGTDLPIPNYDHFFFHLPSMFMDDVNEYSADKAITAIYKNWNIRSLAALPLYANQRQTGILYLISEEKYLFSGREIRSYPPLTDQMATAIENIRLLKKTEATLEETESLYKISTLIARASSIENLTELVAQYVPTNVDRVAIIQLYLNSNGDLSDIDIFALLDIRKEPQRRRITIPAFTFFIQQFFSSEPVIFSNIKKSKLNLSAKKIFQQIGFSSVLSIPLYTGGRIVGYLLLGSPHSTAFSLVETRLLQMAATGIAQALERLRLFQEAQRRALELQTAAEIARDTTSTLSYNTLLNRIVNLIQERFGFYHTSIYLLDEKSEFAVIEEASGDAGKEMKQRGYKLAVGSDSVIGTVIASQTPVNINDASQSILYSRHPLLPDTQSIIGIPLKLGDHILGAVEIQSDHLNAFSENEVSVLKILVDQIAVAINNARAYELSQQAVTEMQKLDRLKSQFLANMSHELRTPLNSIIGFSKVILKGIDGPVTETQQQDLTAIYNSGQHLLTLINDVLDVSKIEAGKMELQMSEVNLPEIINSIVPTVKGLIKDKPVVLKTILPEKLPLLVADPMRIRQILLNFLSNAAKFTDEGSITVEVEQVTSPEGKAEVMVKVVDSGPGIAPSDQNKLFQPFSQVDSSPTRKTGGTGLGLSICRSFVEMHGGRIGLLWSEVNKGSSFFFTLPISPQEKSL